MFLKTIKPCPGSNSLFSSGGLDVPPGIHLANAMRCPAFADRTKSAAACWSAGSVAPQVSKSWPIFTCRPTMQPSMT